MNNDDFGYLKEYIENELITDINFNGKMLWIDHIKKGRYCIEDFDNKDFINNLCYKIANYVNLSFNVTSPLLEAYTKDLRISIIHESIAQGGNSLSIRKTPAVKRLVRRNMIKDKYATASILNYLESAVAGNKNILIGGLPGVGKTELVKYLSSFIKENERVITIEDTLELRYQDINPNMDVVAIRVNDDFTYVDAIKASLRQKPNWILVAEVRSHEVIHLLESISTGASIMSTLHCKKAKDIPNRILHMCDKYQLDNEQLLKNIHGSIQIGVMINCKFTNKGITRYISEVVEFYYENSEYGYRVIYEDNKNDNEKVKE